MKSLIDQLTAMKPLSREEAFRLMSAASDGALTSEQIRTVLTAFLHRPPAAIEISGFRAALAERALPLSLGIDSFVDLCGSGGDGKNTFNISTCAAFVVAAAGYFVVKHGNYGATSGLGSSNVLEALGAPFSENQEEARRQLERCGVVFLHAPHWHPALKAVAETRKQLGFRTIFNILGPLLNPARPPSQLIGAHSREVQDLYAAVLREDSVRFAVVHALDGYDEVALTGLTRIVTPAGDEVVSPTQFGCSPIDPSHLRAGTTREEAAQIVVDTLSGLGPKARISVVAANAALAIQTINPALTLDEAVSIAEESLRSGEALKLLQKCISRSPVGVPVAGAKSQTILDRIATQNRTELPSRMKSLPIEALKARGMFQLPRRSLKEALSREGSSGLIAEIKRKSPSRGVLRENVEVEAIAGGYGAAGAAGISVLTDEHFFGGTLADLEAARNSTSLPLLRKDFVLDEYHLYEARAFGADAVLLIAAMLTADEIRSLSRKAKSLGLEVLLEVHTREEIERSFSDSIDMIGVNNRNLHDFSIDVARSLDLMQHLPSGVTTISESGLGSAETISSLKKIGYDGFLIGEAFMSAEDPGKACSALIRELRT